MIPIGLIGLAAMGRNLALNLMEKGAFVAGFDVDPEYRNVCAKDSQFHSSAFALFSDLSLFINALKPPRTLFLMIKAGDPIDQMLARLVPLLAPGDVIMDGGNSHFTATIRRERELSLHGIRYLGAGISGGTQGARHGPAIMLGGSSIPDPLWSLLQSISAHHESQPCLIHAGTDGAGHFVKMVHNGIEYADMQLLAEAQFLLQNLTGLNLGEQACVFETWNRGALSGYLTAITAKILRKTDPETGVPALEIISDRVDHKGTGQWAAQIALELGVSVPNLLQAVDARLVTHMLTERAALRDRWPVHPKTLPNTDDKLALISSLSDLLLAGRIAVFAQGFKLLATAAQRFRWNLDLGAIAACWRGGCILQGVMPERIHLAFADNPGLVHLLLDPGLGQSAADGFRHGRQVIVSALMHEFPVAGLTTAIAYFDTFRQHHLCTRMVAAQRDTFGAHGFLRTDTNLRTTWDWS
ncbi:MAG: NADP-dependent phosphogluconate dehydrogenase [Nitrospirae bacterium]|nr:NADP-dependent phosphogluconate dehydrogenase [Magnetococcales bacterium]